MENLKVMDEKTRNVFVPVEIKKKGGATQIILSKNIEGGSEGGTRVYDPTMMTAFAKAYTWKRMLKSRKVRSLWVLRINKILKILTFKIIIQGMNTQNKDNIENLERIRALRSSIEENEHKIGEHINTHRYQTNLLKETENWNRICSSLEVIEDTLLAIDEYIKNQYPETPGLQYIYTYGILQALFQQQDALQALSKSFKLDYKHNDNQKLLNIRFQRNATLHPIGHQGKYYNHISRRSLSKEGFILMKYEKNEKDPTFDNINIYSIIENQFKEVKSLSDNITKNLESIDKEHLDKFKNNLLEDVFHRGMRYEFEKVAEGIYSKENCRYTQKDFFLSCLKSIEDAYKCFQEKLEERSELTYSINFDLKQYNHAISRIKSYLDDEDSKLMGADALIYLFYIREEHKRFVEIAKEIDTNYQKNNTN